MKFRIALALAALTASVAAKDYEFDMFYPSYPNTGCGGKAEHIADSGEKGCSSYFTHGAASAWKLSSLKDGCVVNFYSDKQCQDKLDWIDGKSPKGQCKDIPGYTAARAFEVKCS
ncbi:hypothetical protein GGR53DRAFT_289496 [Hypoxylon sp. FL1150]|nr:hypothetical protein GGR53DRAFT_289496 [Hypoxylon sp. FL1150]